jgi:hypothetical protein
MEQVRFELKGWKAVAVVAIVLGVSGYRLSTRFPNVDENGREAIRDWLVKDYQGNGPRALAQKVADYRAGLPVAPDAPQTALNVEFSSLSAHGLRDLPVVRVEITVDGAPPPDGRTVRYLHLTRGTRTVWMVMAEATAISYYRALLD